MCHPIEISGWINGRGSGSHLFWGLDFVQGYGRSTLTSFARCPGRLRVLCRVAHGSTSCAHHTLLRVAHTFQLSIICSLVLHCFWDSVLGRMAISVQQVLAFCVQTEPTPCLQQSATAHHACVLCCWQKTTLAMPAVALVAGLP